VINSVQMDAVPNARYLSSKLRLAAGNVLKSLLGSIQNDLNTI
jgi:hypothetical protein